MTSPDLNLLRRKIGIESGEDFRWVHEIRFYLNSGGCYTITLGGRKNFVSVRWLRSLLHLSRLDRTIDQRIHDNKLKSQRQGS